MTIKYAYYGGYKQRLNQVLDDEKSLPDDAKFRQDCSLGTRDRIDDDAPKGYLFYSPTAGFIFVRSSTSK